MNNIKTTIISISLLILCCLFSCGSGAEDGSVSLRVTEARAPLRLERMNKRNTAKSVDVPTVVHDKIQEIVYSHYKGLGGDEAESIFTIASGYIHTFRMNNGTHYGYITILKDPANKLFGKVILYNHETDELIEGITDLNLASLYKYRNDSFLKSDLVTKRDLAPVMVDLYSIKDNGPKFFMFVEFIKKRNTYALISKVITVDEGQIFTLMSLNKTLGQ